ncbi:MAG TPA: ABC transporter ATP-binding protein, partial [Devosia sp.]|nr:ABC transporter ATP-binding protein [Devosia sp.]
MTPTDSASRRGPAPSEPSGSFREQLENLRHLGRLVAQIWRTSRWLTGLSIGLRLIRAMQPVAMLYVGKLIIDEVVRLTGQPMAGSEFAEWWASGELTRIAELLAIEFALVIVTDLLNRDTSLVDSVLGELHSNTVSMELMQHAAR